LQQGLSREESVRIAVMGSGGVGGFFGAKLARGGADVNFVARGAHLAAMREHGIAIESTDESFSLPNVNVTDDPATIGPVDLVMFGVKLWDTEQAARSLKPIIGRETALISFQNGVQKDDLLRPIVGESAIMGGVAYVGTNISRPGVIAQKGPMQRLVFGEYDGRRSRRAEEFLAACQRGGINAEISADVRSEIWQKFIFLASMAAATASTRKSLGPVRSHPLTRQFFLDLMREVAAVGRAHGVAIPDNFAEQRLAFADTLHPDMSASMHHDLEQGRPLELQWLSGGVVDLGAKVGVPTPLHRAVRDALILHAAGRPDSKPA
jgi:2-dehydropantoate 2-reductase